MTSDRTNLLIPDIRKAIQARSTGWSYCVASSNSNALGIGGRQAAAEIDWVSTRSTSSPGQSSDVTRALQEEVHQLDAKATFSLKNISKEVVDIRAWLTTMDRSIEEQSKELKGLRTYLKEVDFGRFFMGLV